MTREGWETGQASVGPSGLQGRTEAQSKSNQPETEAAHSPLSCSAGLWANVGVGLPSQLCWGPAPSLGPLLPLTPLFQLPNKSHGNKRQGLPAQECDWQHTQLWRPAGTKHRGIWDGRSRGPLPCKSFGQMGQVPLQQKRSLGHLFSRAQGHRLDRDSLVAQEVTCHSGLCHEPLLVTFYPFPHDE